MLANSANPSEKQITEYRSDCPNEPPHQTTGHSTSATPNPKNEIHRIGVATLYAHTNNYGQVLQCYALQSYLRRKGFNPYVIPCVIEGESIGGILRRLTAKKVAKELSSIHAKRENAKKEALVKDLDKSRGFDGFRKTYLAVGDAEYTTLRELKNNPPAADAYICGSDVIWGHDFASDKASLTFLDFGDDATLRLSYAASFGRDVHENELASLKKRLSKFDHISVREQSSIGLLERVGITGAELVVDPTLLLKINDYPMEQDGSPAPFLFAYIVNAANPDAVCWDEVKDYASQREINVSLTQASGYSAWETDLFDVPSETPSIPQWIGKIAGCECVVTSSYHGVLFSILAHKPFITFSLSSQKAGNDRIATALDRLGLTNRLYDPQISFYEQMDRTIDWESVDERLAKWRYTSKKYLLDSLGSAQEP